MNIKKLIAAAVVGAFAVPAFAGAVSYESGAYSGTTETLVEGHTVFAVIQATLCVDNIGDKNDTYDNEVMYRCPKGSSSDLDVSYDVRANVSVQRMGAAVAVLVRDRVKEYVAPPVAPQCNSNRDIVATLFYENPGVLWFNDQFLVGDDLDLLEIEADANVDVCQRSQKIIFEPPESNWRYPCGGWVFATQSGNPDPRDYMTLWTYEESYRIVDPNDFVWIIHKYGVLPAPVGVSIPYSDNVQDFGLDDDAPGYDADDAADGDLRVVTGNLDGNTAYDSDPTNDAAYGYYLGYYNLWSVPILGFDTPDPGPTSGETCEDDLAVDGADHDETPYHDGDDDAPTRKYNAVLFFFFEDLVSGAVYNDLNPLGDESGPSNAFKIHGEGGMHDEDTSGCEEGTEWDCGSFSSGADRTDGDEGNSHPFNPDSDDSGPRHVHPTAAVDLYFSNLAPPTPTSINWAVYDTQGSNAPYHSHDSDSTGFDDRVRIDPCVDVDYHKYDSTYSFNGADYNSTGLYYDNGSYSGSSNDSHTEYFRYGESRTTDPANPDDCTGYYDGGSTGYWPEYY